MSVYLPVFVREQSKLFFKSMACMSDLLINFCAYSYRPTYGCDSVPLHGGMGIAKRYVGLYLWFMDDVIFAHNGPYGCICRYCYTE